MDGDCFFTGQKIVFQYYKLFNVIVQKCSPLTICPVKNNMLRCIGWIMNDYVNTIHIYDYEQFIM